MEWLPTAQEWTAFWTFGLFATAAVSAWYAFTQIKEGRDLRRLEYQAYVYVYPELVRRGGFINLLLVLENVGRTVAENVSVEFEPELRTVYDTPDDKVADYDVWSGLDVLVPGQKFRVALGSQLPEGENRYEVTVRYRSSAVSDDDSEEIVVHQVLDLDVWGMAFVDTDEADDRNVVRALREIADRIGPKRLFSQMTAPVERSEGDDNG